MNNVIEIQDIVKNYQVGSVIVRALRSVSLNARDGICAFPYSRRVYAFCLQQAGPLADPVSTGSVSTDGATPTWRRPREVAQPPRFRRAP